MFPTSCTSLGFSLFVPQTRVSRECYSETYLTYRKTDKIVITHLWHTIEVRTKETNRKERTKKEKAKRPSFQRALIEQTGDDQTYKKARPSPIWSIYSDSHSCMNNISGSIAVNPIPTTPEPTPYRNRWSSSRPPSLASVKLLSPTSSSVPTPSELQTSLENHFPYRHRCQRHIILGTRGGRWTVVAKSAVI